MSIEGDKKNHYLLKDWRPENEAFWENKGKAIARRNLWISVLLYGTYYGWALLDGY